MKKTMVVVYSGQKRPINIQGYLAPARTRKFGRYDTWVAYDYLWNLLGCKRTRGEASSLVLIRAGAWG
jgi:hypothetical protein